MLDTSSRPQVGVFAAAWQALQREHGTIITLPCGTGKTNIAIALMVHLGLKTIVLCHNSSLLKQWRGRLEGFVQGGIRIGHLQQDTVDVHSKDVVLASLQSLYSRTYPPEALRYGLCIVDEVHHLAAHTFAWALKKLEYVYALGLTATLQRKDKLEHIICDLMGRPCVSLGPFAVKGTFHFPVKSRPDVQVNIVHFSGGQQRVKVYRNGQTAYSTMVTWLTEDAVRNSLLLSIIRRMYQYGRQGLLLSDRVDHLKELYEQLGDDNAEIFTGQYKTLGEPEGEKEFTKYLTLSTYRQFAEAMDFCGNFIILATPVSSVEQSIGRILRDKMSFAFQEIVKYLESLFPCTASYIIDYWYEVLRPVVIDIADTFSVFKFMGYKRARYYKEAGFDIIDIQT
jgi:superfamily II DNA or RNA helicase